MSRPPSFKRQRRDEAHQTLMKPFVSPLRTASTSNSNVQNSVRRRSGLSVRQPGTDSIADYGTSSGSVVQHPSSTASAGLDSVEQLYSSHDSSVSGSSQPPHEKDAEIQALRRRLRSLHRLNRELEADVSTLKQAGDLVKACSDEKVFRLQAQWKQGAQAVAEEVLDVMKQRMSDAEGFSAWRAQESHLRNAFDYEMWKMQFDGGNNENQDEGSDEASRTIGIMGDNDKAQTETVDMRIMLGMMNIAAEVIGFDRETGSWVEAG